MIYHINLLLDEERRTASPLPLNALLRIGVVLVCGSLVVATLLLVFARRQAENRAALARAEWQDLKPQHEKLLRLRTSMVEVRGALRQLQACSHARVAWGEELDNVQAAIPLDVQLTELRASQVVSGATSTVTAVRGYDMHLIGKTSGEDADVHVRRLIDRLSTPAFSNRLESVTVPGGGFRPDPSRGALRTDRVFDVFCRYRSRKFE